MVDNYSRSIAHITDWFGNPTQSNKITLKSPFCLDTLCHIWYPLSTDRSVGRWA
jgi:hypothetical protein